jgi:hypothetical protein
MGRHSSRHRFAIRGLDVRRLPNRLFSNRIQDFGIRDSNWDLGFGIWDLGFA